MRSGISFFNWPVFKKTFLRFWPIWAINLVFWLILLPIQGLMELQYGDLWNFSLHLSMPDVCLIFALIAGPAAAMAAFSHLYGARPANFFGSMPVRRGALFVSHYLAGLAMLVVPNVLAFLLTIPVELAGDALFLPPLLFWLGCICAMELFFYSFAVCLGMFTGHILVLPVFYGTFNAIAYALYMACCWVLDNFYYGWPGRIAYGPVYEAIQWLTPVLRLANVDGYTHVLDRELPSWSWALGNQVFVVNCGGYLAIYAAAAVALAVCALLLYRARRLESAGDVVAVRAMRPVFKYGVAVCAGLFLGMLTGMVLDSNSTPVLMICMLFWAVVGCFAAQMLLDKTFRVFRKWKGPVAVAGVFVLAFLAIGFDITGYETRVPSVDQVEYAEVTGLNVLPNDSGNYWDDVRLDTPEQVALAVDLHQYAVDNRNGRQNWGDGYYFWGYEVTYHLKSGAQMSRYYPMSSKTGDENVEGTPTWIVQKLVDDKELMWQVYGFQHMEKVLNDGGRLVSVRLEWPGELIDKYTHQAIVDTPDGYAYEASTDMPVPAPEEQFFYGADARALWDAMKTDFFAGNIGRHRVDAENGYDLLRLMFEVEGPRAEGGTLYGGAGVYYENEVNPTWYTEIVVPDTARNTWEVLERLSAAAPEE